MRASGNKHWWTYIFSENSSRTQALLSGPLNTCIIRQVQGYQVM